MVDAGRGACVDSLLAVFTPAQRAGQLLMVGVPADDPTADAASVVASRVGGVFLRGRSSQPKTTVTANVSALQHAVAAAAGYRCRFPLTKRAVRCRHCPVTG